jgi:hypothetical protein
MAVAHRSWTARCGTLSNAGKSLLLLHGVQICHTNLREALSVVCRASQTEVRPAPLGCCRELLP